MRFLQNFLALPHYTTQVRVQVRSSITTQPSQTQGDQIPTLQSNDSKCTSFQSEYSQRYPDDCLPDQQGVSIPQEDFLDSHTKEESLQLHPHPLIINGGLQWPPFISQLNLRCGHLWYLSRKFSQPRSPIGQRPCLLTRGCAHDHGGLSALAFLLLLGRWEECICHSETRLILQNLLKVPQAWLSGAWQCETCQTHTSREGLALFREDFAQRKRMNSHSQ